MHYSLMTQILAEFIGTAFMVALGNGSVANVELKGTKGTTGDWMIIAWGYGLGVMIPALMIGHVSGNFINPAFTIGFAVNGMLPWSTALLFIVAQLIGAMVGQLIVVAMYLPYYRQTTNQNSIYATFSTIENAGSIFNGFVAEFFGSFILFFGALAMTNNVFGGKVGLESAHLGIGFLVVALVASLGGPTGPALNPARDFGPRILHQILPFKNKGTSHWEYAWVPIVAPIAAGIIAVTMFNLVFK